MESKTSEKKKLFTYTVWGLDVWGHSHQDCQADCKCREECHACQVEENGCEDMGDDCAVEHDHEENDCDCSYEVNDRSRCGTITVVVTGEKFNVGTEHEGWHPTHDDLIKALVEGAFLNERCLPGGDVTIDIQGEDDATLFLEDESDGEPLVQLEFEKSEDLESASTMPPPKLEIDEPLRPFFVKGGAA